MAKQNRIIAKKRTWEYIKSKLTDTILLDYAVKKYGYQVFCLIGNTKFVTNLYDPNYNRKVHGKASSNDVDYAEFVASYITIVDTTPPPVETIPVEIPSVISEVGKKIATHQSAKPIADGKEFYVVWTGAGDDLSTHDIGQGELLQFKLASGTAELSKKVYFDPLFGDTYIHEAYIKFHGGGLGDYIHADMIAEASVLQQVANLDLILDGNEVKYSPGGPGTGTHGFAATPTLIKRSMSMDGAWDYNSTNGLLPNMTNTGKYKIMDVDYLAHRYINKIPCLGDSYGYTMVSSDETAYCPPGYHINITAHNVSDGNWNCTVFMEIFRESTVCDLST